MPRTSGQCRRHTTGCSAPSSARTLSRCGRLPRCTGRRSSTRGTSRRSWRTNTPRTSSASTRSCAPTSGTSWRMRNAAASCLSTGRWRATTRMCERTRSPHLGWVTTSGSWRSRRTTCSASLISCATYGAPRLAAMSAKRCRSTAGPGSRSRHWSTPCPDRGQGLGALSGAGSVAGRPVNAFAEQIGMAVVTGILLDHVDVDPAQRDLVSPSFEGVVQGLGPGSLVSGLALSCVCRQVLLGIGIGDVVEVSVPVLLGTVQSRQPETGSPGAEPCSLDLGHVSHEAEKRQARRTDRGSFQLVVAQTDALPQQCPAMELQPALVHRALVADVGRIVAELALICSGGIRRGPGLNLRTRALSRVSARSAAGSSLMLLLLLLLLKREYLSKPVRT